MTLLRGFRIKHLSCLQFHPNCMLNQYQIDPAHSSVQFSIRHLMISNVRGGFRGVKGTISFDPDNLAASGIQAEIDVSTITTGDDTRDTHLKSPDFFDVAQYPTMSFASTEVEKIGDQEYRATGNLTIHGVTKPVVLKIEEVADEARDPWGNVRIAATAKGKISRKDFGLNWNAVLETGGVLVGDDVKIELDVQAIKAAAAAA